MSVSVVCPGCDSLFRVAQAKRGRRVKCPSCGTVVQVPDLDDAEVIPEHVDVPSSRARSKKRRKKKSSSANGLPILIGAAVVIVAVVGIGLASRRAAPVVLPADTRIPEQQSLTADNTVPAPSSGAQIPLAPAIERSSDAASGLPRVQVDDEPKPTAATLRASEVFFSQGRIPELRIEIDQAEMETLKAGPRTFVIGSPRPYVRGSIREDGMTTYENVAIKLKGSAGSFRPVDDRPALTIHVSKNEKSQTFHGLSKFHLNNSVQDDTYLHEWLCEELFRAAKLPATQVTHARVWLNDRDLGLYVLKSAFDKAFLKRHFADAKGNLYEGGFVQDIDAELEKDTGKGPDDRSDLKALLEACRERDPATRWDRVGELLNVDQFISFMAMEMMVGHWDGYTLNHNNYRLYFDPTLKQAHFLPHGMDQVFGNAGASIIDFPSSIVSSTVMLNGEWRTLYRERVRELLTLFSPTDNLLKRVDLANDRLRPVLAKISPQAAQDHDDRVKRLKDRLVARVENLIEQQSQSDPKPLEFDDSGRLKLSDWYAVSESPDAKLEVVDLPKGIKAYSILCGANRCNASWRCKTLLAKGTYRLHASMKTLQVNAPDEKGKVVGTGIRISGVTRPNVRKGTVNWTPVEFEFTVIEDVRKIEFVAELQARKGQVWFDVESLYLTRSSKE